jgi:hypothetical protein
MCDVKGASSKEEGGYCSNDGGRDTGVLTIRPAADE